jgi:hypothetical protein
MIVLSNNEELPKEVMSAMNEVARKYYDEVWQNVMCDCTNPNVLKVVNDWWHGENVYEDNYMSGFTDSELRDAHDRILTLIHMGCG